MSIEAISISKQFGRFAALNQVDLEIRTGELVALIPAPSASTAKTSVTAPPANAALDSYFSTMRFSVT